LSGSIPALASSSSFESSSDTVDGDVVVSVSELVGLVVAGVHGQLQAVAVPWQAEIDVVRGVEIEPPADFESELLVEGDARIDIANPDARVDESIAASRQELQPCSDRGRSSDGVREKKPCGFIVKPVRSTCVIGQSSGRGM
jgi:hypothetical protein